MSHKNNDDDGTISMRFSTKKMESLNHIAKSRGLKLVHLLQYIASLYTEILNKCFKRRDMITQRTEIAELYSMIPHEKLDVWVESKFEKTLSCMKMFIPKLEFNEMTDIWIKWYDLNSHHLEYEDIEGWREFHCITDVGYNWIYVYGTVYCKIFESENFEVKDFSAQNEGFSFKVKIPD